MKEFNLKIVDDDRKFKTRQKAVRTKEKSLQESVLTKNKEQKEFELKIKEYETHIVIGESKITEENKKLSERKAYLLHKDLNTNKREKILNNKVNGLDKLEDKLK